MKSRAAAVAGLLLALAVVVFPSQGVTRDISLTSDGPVPNRIRLMPGDRVQFVNNDSVPHQVVSQSGWQYNSGPIPPGVVSAETPPFTAPGNYDYDDLRGFVVRSVGRVTVPKPAPTASPSPTPTKASPTPSPTRSATPAPTPTPSPTSATPSPTPSASPSAVPSPTPATASPSPAPTPAPQIRYGVQQALVQSSPHRYGLPALIALVAIVGVLSLLLRYLLFLAPSQRGRTNG